VPGPAGAVAGEPAALWAGLARPVLDGAQVLAELAARVEPAVPVEAALPASHVAAARAQKERAGARIAAASVPLFSLPPAAEPAEPVALADVGIAARVRLFSLRSAAVPAEPVALADAGTAAVSALFSLRPAGQLAELAEPAGAEILAALLCSMELEEPESLPAARSALREELAQGVLPPASPQPEDAPRELCNW